MSKEIVKSIITELGSSAIEERLGVSSHAVRKAGSDGFFSGLWYQEIKLMCDEKRVGCPMDAFRFKSAETVKGAA